jgi:hypothetical protein
VVLDLKSVPTSQLDNFADQILAAPWDAYNVPASTFAHAIKSGKILTEDVPGLSAAKRLLARQFGELDVSIVKKSSNFVLQPSVKAEEAPA